MDVWVRSGGSREHRARESGVISGGQEGQKAGWKRNRAPAERWRERGRWKKKGKVEVAGVARLGTACAKGENKAESGWKISEKVGVRSGGGQGMNTSIGRWRGQWPGGKRPSGRWGREPGGRRKANLEG